MRRLGYECTACGEFFSSDSSFRKHRRGSYGDAIYDTRGKKVIGYTKSQRRCLTIEEILKNDFHKNSKNQWSFGSFDAIEVFSKQEEVEETQATEEVAIYAT